MTLKGDGPKAIARGLIEGACPEGPHAVPANPY